MSNLHSQIMKMKKILQPGLTAVLAAFYLVSCNTQEPIAPVDVQAPIETLKSEVGVINGILAFESTDIYESHLEKMRTIPEGLTESQHMDQIETALNFQSKRSLFLNAKSKPNARTLAEDGIHDERLASILNEDNMVQIDQWIFKLDLLKKKCYALALDDATSALVDEMKTSTPSDAKIQVYSTEEDVLDLLASGTPSKVKNLRVNGLFGNDAKLDYFVWYDPSSAYIYDNDDRGKIECKVVYQQAGVYFSLQAKIKYHAKSPGGLYLESSADLCIDYIVLKYQSKKNSIGDQDHSNRPTDCGFRSEVSYRPYESSRGLNKYWYEVTFSISGLNNTLYVPNFGIKSGY